jgi:hypothetical protein
VYHALQFTRIFKVTRTASENFEEKVKLKSKEYEMGRACGAYGGGER